MERYGAMIERGVIVELDPNGYIVKSLDRDGITSPPLQKICEDELSVGDTVCFFLFNDGTGRVACLFHIEVN